MEEMCEWKLTEEEFWASGCGKAFQFDEGGAFDNDFVFCPYCGKRLEQID